MKYFRLFMSYSFFATVFFLTLRCWGLQSPLPTFEPIFSLIHKQSIAFEFPRNNHPILAQYLPAKGVISVIFDKPYHPLGGQEALLFQTQNAFIPILLNPYSGEDIALVLCSTDAIAKQRLTEMRYEWVQKISPGKGIARFLP
jgi:hypothetical protein